LGISRSASKLRENDDIGGINDQFITKTKDSSVFEEGYIYNIPDADILTLSNLIVFSVSTLSNSSILKIP